MADFDWANASKPQEQTPAAEEFDWKSAKEPNVSRLKAFGHGMREGGSLGFSGELGGLQQAAAQLVSRSLPRAVAGWAEKHHPLYTPPAKDADGRDMSLGDVYRAGRDGNAHQEDAVRAARPNYYLGGELLGGGLIPGGTAAKGLKGGRALLRAAGAAGGVGGVGGLGYSKADITKGEGGSALVDALVTAAISAPIGVAARALPGALKRFGARKGAAIDETVARAANAESKAVTQEARSAAGNAATAAYKQPENLVKSGRMADITPEQAELVAKLNQELGDSAEKNLGPNAARKAETAEVFAEAVKTEGQRASELASKNLGGAERLRKTMDRVKRYGVPAVLSGIAGGATGLLGGIGGGIAGAAGGSVLGVTLRPMVRSLVKLARDPVWSRPAMSLVEALGGGSEHVAARSGAPVAHQLDPQAQALLRELLPQMAKTGTDEERQELNALAESLLGAK